MAKFFAWRLRPRTAGGNRMWRTARLGGLLVGGMGLVLGAACDNGIQAGTLEPSGDRTTASTTDTPSATADEPTPQPTDGETDASEPTGGPDEETPEEDEIAVNVCELVPPERVRAILDRDKTPKLGKPEEVSGIPGVGTVYRCTYSFEPGQTAQNVTISAMTETGDADPSAYVASVLGDGYEQVGGFGDAAGAIRAARFGNGTGAFAQARKTDDGVGGVFILGPEESTDEQFGRLSDEFFSALKAFEEQEVGQVR